MCAPLPLPLQLPVRISLEDSSKFEETLTGVPDLEAYETTPAPIDEGAVEGVDRDDHFA